MLEQIGTIVDFDPADALGWIELDQGGRVRFGATSLRGFDSVTIGTRVVVHGTKPGHKDVLKAVAVVPLVAPGAAGGPQGTMEEPPAVQDRMRPVERSTQPYDRVRITNLVDGTTIEGHEAVQAHFEEEQALLDEHGMSITFQVFRIHLAATSIGELQGRMLTALKVPGDFASGTDTVADVKDKLRPLIEQAARSHPDAETRRALTWRAADRMAFSFSNSRMLDDDLFYADHFMMLPAWVQVLLHECDHEELMAIADKLHRAADGRA